MLITSNLEVGPEWQGPIQPLGPNPSRKPNYLQVATEGATVWIVDATEMPDPSFVGWMVVEGEGIVDINRVQSLEDPVTYVYMRSSAPVGKTVTVVVACYDYD